MVKLDKKLLTYEYYKDKLYLNKIPNAEDFNAYLTQNIAYISKYLPYMTELCTNGAVNSVCYMVEYDYLSDIQRLELSTDKMVSSESIGSVSQSYTLTRYNKLIDLNTLSTEKVKYKLIKLFNTVNVGMRR